MDASRKSLSHMTISGDYGEDDGSEKGEEDEGEYG